MTMFMDKKHWEFFAIYRIVVMTMNCKYCQMVLGNVNMIQHDHIRSTIASAPNTMIMKHHGTR